MTITYSFALKFVEERTPRSAEVEKKLLARRLVDVCEKYDKTPEEAWAFNQYWMGC